MAGTGAWQQCYLVAQPVGALDGVVGMPSPVVFRHVAQRCVDAPLRGHSVRARGEQLCDAPAHVRQPASAGAHTAVCQAALVAVPFLPVTWD